MCTMENINGGKSAVSQWAQDLDIKGKEINTGIEFWKRSFIFIRYEYDWQRHNFIKHSLLIKHS